MKTLNMRYLHHSTLILLIILASSCSHKFDSNVLDLAFYQWNLWPDVEAMKEDGPPSCGWDELHRGNGKLVRIPALVQDHFQDHRATGNGVYLLISLLSNALMLIVIGYIGDLSGLKSAYLISSAAALLSIPALRLIPVVEASE